MKKIMLVLLLMTVIAGCKTVAPVGPLPSVTDDFDKLDELDEVLDEEVVNDSALADAENEMQDIEVEIESEDVAVEEPDPFMITMTDEGYSPRILEITHGDTVTFYNAGTLNRWPATNDHLTHEKYPNSSIHFCDWTRRVYMFDSCMAIGPGESYIFRFDAIGNWAYHDHLRPSEGGVIIVK